MKKIDLGQTIQILANIGVLAGIVFLAIELRQNNELLASEARRNRAASVEASYGILSQDSELASLVLKDVSDESLSELERFRLQNWYMRVLTNLGWAYGEMSPDELSGAIIAYRPLFSGRASIRETWAERKFSFDQDFMQWVDENIASEP